MLWLPMARLVVVKVAIVKLPVVLKIPWPRPVAPSENTTVPVGLPELLTVAVNVRLCFQTAGLADEATEVLVLASITLKGMEIAPERPRALAVSV